MVTENKENATARGKVLDNLPFRAILMLPYGRLGGGLYSSCTTHHRVCARVRTRVRVSSVGGAQLTTGKNASSGENGSAGIPALRYSGIPVRSALPGFRDSVTTHHGQECQLWGEMALPAIPGFRHSGNPPQFTTCKNASPARTPLRNSVIPLFRRNSPLARTPVRPEPHFVIP